MQRIEIQALSAQYRVRKLDAGDVELIFSFSGGHAVYEEHCGAKITRESIENDLRITPPGIPSERKLYVGFFENNDLIAVIDLIEGYPAANEAFIGFFMVNASVEGKGIGSRIVTDTLVYLKRQGFTKCSLGIDRGNPQSTHFWKKNGFEIEREVCREQGVILVAGKKLRS